MERVDGTPESSGSSSNKNFNTIYQLKSSLSAYRGVKNVCGCVIVDLFCFNRTFTP